MLTGTKRKTIERCMNAERFIVLDRLKDASYFH
jgi:hypothetical protein